MMDFPLPQKLVMRKLSEAFAEDLADAGDVTTQAIFGKTEQATAFLCARSAGVISGSGIAREAFLYINPDLKVATLTEDGQPVTGGQKVLKIEGPAADILRAERTALNFIGHMSGIATATHSFVEKVDGLDAKIVCTRKTLPGLRAFQKYAVRCGGGHNHRFGLYDGVMIKDNHIQAAGSIRNALMRVKASLGHMVKIEIEVDTLSQLEEVLRLGCDVILLDNMSLSDLRDAVHLNNGQCLLEASGNVTLETVRSIAETGVDIISSGWLTHSAPNMDLGLDFIKRS